MRRIVEKPWRAPSLSVNRSFRLVEEDGVYELETRLGSEDWQPTVKGDGHSVARKVAEVLREADLERNVVQLKKARSG